MKTEQLSLQDLENDLINRLSVTEPTSEEYAILEDRLEQIKRIINNDEKSKAEVNKQSNRPWEFWVGVGTQIICATVPGIIAGTYYGRWFRDGIYFESTGEAIGSSTMMRNMLGGIKPKF